MKTSEWIKAQPEFLGAQGKTVFDPDFDIDDGGLPHEKPALPKADGAPHHSPSCGDIEGTK